MAEMFTIRTPDECRKLAGDFERAGNSAAAVAYRHLAMTYERLNHSDELLRSDLCNVIARDRGWHPLVLNEEMTVHFAHEGESERRRYVIKRTQ